MLSQEALWSLYQKYQQYPRIAIHSGQALENSIYIGLEDTQASNGPKFAEEALRRGAAYALISENWNQKQNIADDRLIAVPDTLRTLQQLATHHRKQLPEDMPIIAITGSNGKTTTTALLKHVLKSKYRTGGTEGNFNGRFGVALTILSICPTDEIAVIEMGADELGNLELACSVSMPTHGLITNIGLAHLGTFGGVNNIITGKLELYEYLSKTNGTFFLNMAEPALECIIGRAKKYTAYPTEESRCKILTEGPFLVYETNDGEIIRTNLIGKHNLMTIMTAVYIGMYFEIDKSLINAAIADFEPVRNRGDFIRSGSNVIFLDAFNANPTSMKCALESFDNMQQTKKVVILGSMLGLGDESVKHHEEIVRLTAENDYLDMIFCGLEMCKVKYCNAKGRYFEDKSAAKRYLSGQIYKDTAILIKASRALELETLLPALGMTSELK